MLKVVAEEQKKTLCGFYYISGGSLYELETHLIIGIMIEFLEEAFEKRSVLIDEYLRMLNGLIKR